MGTAKIFDAFSEPASFQVAIVRNASVIAARPPALVVQPGVGSIAVAILGEGATVEAREVFRFFWLGTHALRLSQQRLQHLLG